MFLWRQSCITGDKQEVCAQKNRDIAPLCLTADQPKAVISGTVWCCKLCCKSFSCLFVCFMPANVFLVVSGRFSCACYPV